MAGKFKWIFIVIPLLVGLSYLLLLIPSASPDVSTQTVNKPFIWNQDSLWQELEKLFVLVKNDSCPDYAVHLNSLEQIINSISDSTYPPASPLYDSLENLLFIAGVYTAACPAQLDRFITLTGVLRQQVKQQSRLWDINEQSSRVRLYRMLYGSRMVIEEIILQHQDSLHLPLLLGDTTLLATPANSVMGLTLQSGDILVSRGGAPTSALIARGSDYPGNFSHIALVHVDSLTNEIRIIESHIEIGVAIADWDSYIKDKKLRILTLRLHPDHPLLETDPMLPHTAASNAMNRAQNEHIAYDFAMDYEQYDKLFCSEVPSSVYAQLGVTLWMHHSTISDFGLRTWLSDFGVTNFITQEPSDLEYDPQLQVVGEWRDPQTLVQDRLDNAVIDVMLEQAEKIGHLRYNRWLLPVVRVMKAYSMLLNLFEKAGPIPEGMSATSALQNDWFSTKHLQIKKNLIPKIETFRKQNGYFPPYWAIIKLARTAAEEQNFH